MIAKRIDLIQRIKDALGTDEDGDALVKVAAAAHRAEQELAIKRRRLDFPFLMFDADRHGDLRLFVRRYGRKIRIREKIGTIEFGVAYANALGELERKRK